MRAVLLRGLVVGLILGTGAVSSAVGAGASAAPGAKAVYVVRPDLRACPSPLCGGYWVALANRARTTCADGLRRPRCYVAMAVDAQGRTWPKPLAPGALVAGRLATRSYGQLGDLEVLVAGEQWSPADATPAQGRFFSVRDTGLRCVRSPCFSYRALELNIQRTVRISGVALGPAGAGSHVGSYARFALRAREGLLAAGTFSVIGGGGRVFLASQLYLRRWPPRA